MVVIIYKFFSFEDYCILANILKRLAAILLIALFIFNLFGYRILFYSIQQQSDIDIEKSLDNDQYNDKDLITITIPLSVPYQNAWSDFERFDGEVNFNGKIYKYVKRKVTQGNLVLLCLPDENKMRLENVKSDLAKTANDFPGMNSKKSINSKVEKNTASDYNQCLADYSIVAINGSDITNSSFIKFSLVSGFDRSPERPPKFS
jgi:hypothetical protein